MASSVERALDDARVGKVRPLRWRDPVSGAETSVRATEECARAITAAHLTGPELKELRAHIATLSDVTPDPHVRPIRGYEQHHLSDRVTLLYQRDTPLGLLLLTVTTP